jgi:hypothetical protein
MTERWEMLGVKKIGERGMNGKEGWIGLGFGNEKSPKTRAIDTKKGLDSTWLLC